MQLPFTLLVEVSDESKERIKQAADALSQWEGMLNELKVKGLTFTDTVGTPVTGSPDAARGGRKPKVTVVEGPKEAA